MSYQDSSFSMYIDSNVSQFFFHDEIKKKPVRLISNKCDFEISVTHLSLK